MKNKCQFICRKDFEKGLAGNVFCHVALVKTLGLRNVSVFKYKSEIIRGRPEQVTLDVLEGKKKKKLSSEMPHCNQI